MHPKALHVDAILTEAEVLRDSQLREHLVGEGKREARRYRVGRKIRHSVDNVCAAGTPGRIADLRGSSRRDNAAFQNRLDIATDSSIAAAAPFACVRLRRSTQLRSSSCASLHCRNFVESTYRWGRNMNPYSLEGALMAACIISTVVVLWWGLKILAA